jgi:hypothetical protein
MGKRLASADILIVSLREEWTGAAVPSKFFGALAIGRPVLFCGSPKSAVAYWIKQFNLGWVLAPGCAAEVAHEIRTFASSPQEMEAMRQRCYCVYREHFSKQVGLDNWHQAICELIGLPAPSRVPHCCRGQLHHSVTAGEGRLDRIVCTNSEMLGSQAAGSGSETPFPGTAGT